MISRLKQLIDQLLSSTISREARAIYGVVTIALVIFLLINPVSGESASKFKTKTTKSQVATESLTLKLPSGSYSTLGKADSTVTITLEE